MGVWAGAGRLSTDVADWVGAGFQNQSRRVRFLSSVPSSRCPTATMPPCQGGDAGPTPAAGSISRGRLTEGCRSTEPATMVRIHPSRPSCRGSPIGRAPASEAGGWWFEPTPRRHAAAARSDEYPGPNGKGAGSIPACGSTCRGSSIGRAAGFYPDGWRFEPSLRRHPINPNP